MLKEVYDEDGIITTITVILSAYLGGFSGAVQSNLMWLVLGMLVLGSARSVRFVYEHFLKWHRGRSLNSYYHSLRYAKRPVKLPFWKVTVRMALQFIPSAALNVPVFLIVDDTLVPKYGLHFENVKTLFDHADHSGQPYKNGHCFVTVMICIPVGFDEEGQPRFLALPLMHRMWQSGGKSKLEIAREMLLPMQEALKDITHVMLLCDSWYLKAPLLSIRDEWKELHIIGAARIDTALFELPPERTGKRGRPRKRGGRLNAKAFALHDIEMPGYVGASRLVMTKLFGDLPVTAAVTLPASGKGSRRLYLSTMTELEMTRLLQPEADKATPGILLQLYHLRWSIEVGYLELKTYWSLESYRVLSASGIDLLINLELLAYTLTKMLPYLTESFRPMTQMSAQEIRLEVGRMISEELFSSTLLRRVQKRIKNPKLRKALESLIGLPSHVA